MADLNTTPVDQEFRTRILSDLDTTMLVEAGAGTGKTTCLVGRMVSLLAAGKCEIGTLAAVTFTRKAAAELRSRFQLDLEDAVQQASGTEQLRLTQALEHIEQCVIGTIHSFCARLLRERPVEAGVSPAFTELDDSVDTQLREQAWREHVATLVATDDPILPELEKLGLKVTASTKRSSSIADELQELGLDVPDLGPAFLRYAEFPDVSDWPAEAVPLPDTSACVAALRNYVQHIETLELPEDYGNDELIPKYAQLCRMVGILDLGRPSPLMEVLGLFQSSVKIVQMNWPGGRTAGMGNREKQRWADFADEHATPLLTAWREHRYEPVMRVIRPAQFVFDRLRRERSALNYQDLLIYSAEMLRSRLEVRSYFRERFTHLLVDEFQDTDPLQAEIMLLLTADSDETDWQKCRPVPGSLFVVGDPKQSIYRFRRADIQTYNRVRAIVESVGGEVLPLTSNFRSAGTLIDWINNSFNSVFPTSPDNFSPENRPLKAGRPDEPSVASRVERLSIPTSVRYQNPVAEYESDLIARSIRKTIDDQRMIPGTDSQDGTALRPAEPRDFLIVTNRKDRLSIYARALQKYGLPCAVTGSSTLSQIDELKLLSLCINSLLRPDDAIALVALLRSELYGVADTVLYEFRKQGGWFNFYTEVPTTIPSDDAINLTAIFGQLKQLAGWLKKMTAAAAVERIAAELGLFARACAGENGTVHAGSLFKAIELLRDAENCGTLTDCAEFLTQLVSPKETNDGIPVRPPVCPPVRVMNLHQCKGLEAPFVFLADPSGDRVHDVTVHIDRSGDRPVGYMAISGPKRSQHSAATILAHPPGWADLAAREQQFLDAETNRRRYVAATRAGTKLVVSQQGGNSNRQNLWRSFDSEIPEEDEIDIPGESPAPPHDEGVSTVWSPDRDSIATRWHHILQPSYAVEAIKATAIKQISRPPATESGGVAWGNVIHRMLEAAMKTPDGNFESLAAAELKAEGLPQDLLKAAIQTLETVLETDIWKRACRSEQCLTEVPLAVLSAASVDGSATPTIRRGVIDLVFREAGGWVIVDYKSERLGPDSIPELVSYYEPQVRAYTHAWQDAVGQPVVEAGLLFTHAGIFSPTKT